MIVRKDAMDSLMYAVERVSIMVARKRALILIVMRNFNLDAIVSLLNSLNTVN